MKTLQNLILTGLLMVWVQTYGQIIQNSGFENWFIEQYYEDPDQYASTNFASYITTGGANVIKTTDAHSGLYGAKMQTISSVQGNISGALFIGNIGDGYVAGGIPFNVRPDSVVGWVKYDVMPLDTANFIVLFKKFGAPLGVCFVQFTGNQNTYARFSAPVQWLIPIIPPDSLATAISSSSFFTYPLAGSTLTIDDVDFIGVNNPFPNESFEDWSSFSAEEPDGWFTSNIFNLTMGTTSVSKSTDSYEGEYAVEIVSTVTLLGDTSAYISNGTFSDDGPIGGMAIDSIPEVLSGYYKYEPVGPDTALAGLTLFYFNPITGATEMLEEKIIKLPPASNYTYFEIESDYFSLPEPDTLNIAFGSGNFVNSGAFIGLGSKLIIDALQISYKPHIVGIKELKLNSIIQLYPNPATEIINLKYSGSLDEFCEISILDANGLTIKQDGFLLSSKFQHKIDISQFRSGLYFCKVVTNEYSYCEKFLVK